jgi:mannose-6-phosphate isomerase-like protein (cupin superfamily)
MQELPDFKFIYEDFENLFLSREAFEQGKSFYIDISGKDNIIETDTYEEYLAIAQVKLASQFETLKIEGIEKLCGFKDGTVHAFRYWENSPSFGIHKDPVDVIIEVKQGSKVMEVENSVFVIHQECLLKIPANTPHRALNEKEGLMFSYGLYDTE